MESANSFREQGQSTKLDTKTRDILTAGLNLCLEKGWADLDMKQVAAAARVGRATLYRYFPSKKALAYAVLRFFAWEILSPTVSKPEPAAMASGLEKFTYFVEILLASYRQFPEFYRFTGAFDHYFSYQDDVQEMAQLYQDIFMGLYVEKPPYLFLEEGQRDGSVRQGIDPRAYAAMTIESFVAFAHHASVSGELFTILYEIEKAELLPEMLGTLLVRGATAEIS